MAKSQDLWAVSTPAGAQPFHVVNRGHFQSFREKDPSHSRHTSVGRSGGSDEITTAAVSSEMVESAVLVCSWEVRPRATQLSEPHGGRKAVCS